ncbi:lipoyl(octanoyl) transferase LipB [Leucobacter ruminantium]|uniref:Octanoyltransferase n=1 Tax=Leucobacter ruminantium TaxID=1289170 RepID=A0A939RXW2_9MICO|nr:lipoyl(octanoyl) transferase LipB [Leucobacter ruminantium]MBO1803844.1 lipoyl(octanoyl) transferase LipB [Leucobacter ruminantium]
MLATTAQPARTSPPVTPIPTRSAGLSGSPVPYELGMELQTAAAERVRNGEDRGTLLLLEHEPVYTAGRRSLPEEYPRDGTRVIPVDRGGKVTWHGPGQLVAYPVIRLRERYRVVELVRVLEGALIEVAREFGVEGFRVEGRSGVWVDEAERGADPSPAKIAQIGLHTSDGIVTHGIALNCSNSLEPFGRFIPCGISDAGVTTLSRVRGAEVTPREVAPVLEAAFVSVFEEVAE